MLLDFKKYLNHFSISTKVILGSLTIFSLFGTISFIYIDNLYEENQNLDKISKLSKNTSKVLSISKEISELQRLVKAFSSTGGDAVLSKIRLSYHSLKKTLRDVRSETKSAHRINLVESLEGILNKFGDNIEELEELYKHKEKKLNDKLPQAYLAGERLLSSTLASSKNNKDKLNLTALIGLWHKIHLSALNFLRTKNYIYKNDLKKLLLRFELECERVKNFYLVSERLKKVLRDYKKAFELAKQAQRIYLSLVNVIMAGYSIEFTNISKELYKNSSQELKEILLASNKKFKKHKKEVMVNIVVAFILLALISLFLHFNIAQRIKSISSTFMFFIEGDFTKSIPGLQGNDEIGKLAKAADTFKNYSLRLEEEEKKAKASERSKSRFLATMSHEIRTPMNAIVSCTNLLMDQHLSLESKELVSTIKTSGDSLLILIDSILDFSKIESGKINLEKNYFNFKECIKSTLDLLDPKASEHNIDLILSESSCYPEFILGDITRLRQVLLNLIGNAIKFTKDKVTVEVQSSVISEEKEYSNVKVEVFITDNGIGIEKSAFKNLFKDFSQVDASTTRKFGGTGLGLAISKGIVKSMNGMIDVKSEVGVGSTFFFSFQTQSVASLKEEPSPLGGLSDISGIDSGASLNILLVEDNKVNQMVAKKILKNLGYTPDIASNGVEAVEKVALKDYDLILMDQHMPELDGIDATKQIRELGSVDVLIYALTASVFAEDKKRCLESGMNGFLSKPINIKDLKAAINVAVLKKSKDLSKTA